MSMDSSAWDARYAGADLVWSAEPNIWVRELCAPMAPGRVLDVAAGEGRNALWLVEQGWSALATDYSPVAVARMTEIADRRLGDRRGDFTALVADATEPPPEGPAGATAYDLVTLVYLHLPREQWRAALGRAVAATATDGAVLVVAHALRNLAEGVGGPQDPSILLDPDDVVATATELPVEVELAQLRRREVEGGERPALDTVVLLRRLPGAG
jgi:SAM-dependent methyltransferase